MADRDYFKLLTDKTLKEATRIPKLNEIVQQQWSQIKSKYPLRLLGTSQETGDILIAEEDRDQNFHVIGAPKQGKSKFLEHNIIEDIKRGNGVCLIDPSDGGDTMYNVLNYCASIGHKKVCVIDPRTLHDYGKIAVFNPLNPARQEMSINGLMESLELLFDTEMAKTSRIKHFLPALLSILVRTDNTLYETRYFTHFSQDKHIREFIFDQLGEDFDVHTLESVIYKEHLFNQFFASTIFRMADLYREPLKYILSSDGIDFVKMVREGWVILVNLFPGKYMTEGVSQLLGIMIINQIIQAVDILFEAPPARKIKKVFYLYIDETQSFATKQIATVLNNKRKTGLRLIFAHHYTGQFQNKVVKDAIMASANVKVMFNVSDGNERRLMMDALGYGGDITPQMAAFANMNLPKQHAVIRKGKEFPVRARIPDVKNPKVSKDKFDAYMESILENDWYLTKDQINERINARIIQANTASVKSGKVANPKANRKTVIPRGVSGKLEKDIRPDNKESSDAPPKRPIKI